MRRLAVPAILLLPVLGALGGAAAAGDSYTFAGKFGSPGQASGQFSQPVGIAVEGSAGNVYVADTGNNRIQEFGPRGGFVRAWGGSGQLAGPADVAVDRGPPYAVYATDTLNHRIRKYSAAGQLLATWGAHGTQPGQLVLPRGLATDAAGNLYVAQPDRVTKFTSTGGFVAAWGSTGSGPGQFRYLADVAVDPAGNVYTVDRDLGRVQKFSPSGALLATWGSPGTGDGQLSGAIGIAADATGVYVSDTGNTRVQKFGLDGAFLTKWGSRGTGDGQFTSPSGLFVSPRTGDVYVLDFLGCCSRVQIFGRAGGGAAAPPPVAGKAVDVSVVSGVVRIRVKGSKRFADLTADRQIPTGSEVDTTRGRVRLTTAAPGGATYGADFYAGRFVVTQAKAGTLLSTLRLSAPLRCPRRALAVRRGKERHLWGDGKGAFRTRGRYAAATVRGTIWLTRDTCGATLVRVRAGSVQVVDFVRRRTVVVPAGRSYVARRR